MTKTPDIETIRNRMPSPDEIDAHIARARRMRAEAFGDAIRGIGASIGAWIGRGVARRRPGAAPTGTPASAR